jgi:hypothetical protein
VVFINVICYIAAMIRGVRIAVCVAGGIALTAGAQVSPGNAGPGPHGNVGQGPYHGIVERNVFNLKPPPPAVPPEPPPAAPPKIILTGITTILGNKRALMKVAVPAKPPEPAKEESFILAEDEARADIHVLEIDEKAGTVQVNNHGAVQVLDFKNDGAKQVAVAMPPPAAIPPPIVPQAIPAPAVPNPASPTGRQIPTRTMRLPNAPGANTGAPGVPAVQGYAVPQAGVNNQGASQVLPPEGQMILIEAQRLRYQQEGNPAAAILPPTPLTPQ